MRACVHMPVRVRVLVRVRMLANFDFQPLPLTTVNVYVRSRAHHTQKRRIPCVPPALARTHAYACCPTVRPYHVICCWQHIARNTFCKFVSKLFDSAWGHQCETKRSKQIITIRSVHAIRRMCFANGGERASTLAISATGSARQKDRNALLKAAGTWGMAEQIDNLTLLQDTHAIRTKPPQGH